MAYRLSLVVLTLLQLCRAEISDDLPSWYSANVINDGFQPKPISEIFSTESPFSTTNPIVILPKSTPQDDIRASSTLTSDFSTLATQKLSSVPLTSVDINGASLTPSTTPIPIITSTILPQPPPQQPIEIEFQSDIQQSTQPDLQTISANSNSPQTQSQQIRLEVASSPQNQPVPRLPIIEQPNIIQAPTSRPIPNYFLIYQQAPQSIQSYQPLPIPLSQPIPRTRQTVATTLTFPAATTRQPQPSSPQQTLTTFRQSTPFASQPTLISSTPTTVTRAPLVRVTSRTTPLCQQTQSPAISAQSGGLSIRVVAPIGSITNVKINPSTTTRKPRTRKTSKPKRSNYDVCVDSCKKRDPVCAAPVNASPIDTNQLKGFPSLCHMACHNSFRKDRFEKLADGRCGRLRTRIRTVDSKTKLNKQELIKAEYSIDNVGPKTVIEFSRLAR